MITLHLDCHFITLVSWTFYPSTSSYLSIPCLLWLILPLILYISWIWLCILIFGYLSLLPCFIVTFWVLKIIIYSPQLIFFALGLFIIYFWWLILLQPLKVSLQYFWTLLLVLLTNSPRSMLLSFVLNLSPAILTYKTKPSALNA